MSIPAPVPDEDSAPFWEGCARGELRIQFCPRCGASLYPPRPLCPRCLCSDLTWRRSTGRGRLYTWTVAHHPPRADLAEHMPYTLGLVDLEDGVRMLGLLVDAADADLRPGLPLGVVFRNPWGTGLLPCFSPAAWSSQS